MNATNFVKPLPFNKTAVDVLSDFLKYLNDCAKQYIQERHPGIGSSVWEGDEIHYVLAHPNGWEGAQQDQMRKAAIMAGLIPENPAGQARISFVTEGEASLHFSIQNGLPAGAMTVRPLPLSYLPL